MTLGELIRDRRQRKGLTGEALSRKVDVSVMSVFGYERDSVIPSLPVLQKIAKVLGINLGDLAKTFMPLAEGQLKSKKNSGRWKERKKGYDNPDQQEIVEEELPT